MDYYVLMFTNVDWLTIYITSFRFQLWAWSLAARLYHMTLHKCYYLWIINTYVMHNVYLLVKLILLGFIGNIFYCWLVVIDFCFTTQLLHLEARWRALVFLSAWVRVSQIQGSVGGGSHIAPSSIIFMWWYQRLCNAIWNSWWWAHLLETRRGTK